MSDGTNTSLDTVFIAVNRDDDAPTAHAGPDQTVDEIMQADVLRVAIGSEIEDPVVDACAVISAPFGDGPALGGLGLIGPIRMRYDRLIPLVRRLSDTINGLIA